MIEEDQGLSLDELVQLEAVLAHEVARLQENWHQASRERNSTAANDYKKEREAVQRRQHRVQDQIGRIRSQSN